MFVCVAFGVVVLKASQKKAHAAAAHVRVAESAATFSKSFFWCRFFFWYQVLFFLGVQNKTGTSSAVHMHPHVLPLSEQQIKG